MRDTTRHDESPPREPWGEGKNLVGVDIGSASIKVCQVKDTKKGIGLLRFGYSTLAPSVIVDGQVMDAGAVTEALAKTFHDAKIRQKECALSVSGQSVIIRKISVPMMTDAELAEQIQWEAEQHIPFDIKDVRVDYQVLRKRLKLARWICCSWRPSATKSRSTRTWRATPS